MKNRKPVETFCQQNIQERHVIFGHVVAETLRVLSRSGNDSLNIFSTKESFLSGKDELFPNFYKRPL